MISLSRSQVVWACTIGPVDAGIVAALEEAYEKKTGVKVTHIAAGTSEALKIARSGGVDLVMVHARVLEEQFVAEGYGLKRYDLMYNDFVIVGPASDPAGIGGINSAVEALRRIASHNALFISRGDRSGTHVKEEELWQAAGIKPAGDWYKVYDKGSAGNRGTLLYTNSQRAYTIIDRATYITCRSEIELALLVEKDKLLLNFITVIPVDFNKLPVNYDGANSFVQWLVSSEGQRVIRDFGRERYRESLFFPNSPDGKLLSAEQDFGH